MTTRITHLTYLLILWLCFIPNSKAATDEFPQLSGRVVDETAWLSSRRNVLERRSKHIEASSGIQLVIVALPTLRGENIADYANRLARHWEIGEKSKNNGLLLLYVKDVNKIRLEVAYGLEHVITDAWARKLLETTARPYLQQGDPAKGIYMTVDALSQLLTKPFETSAGSTESTDTNIDSFTLALLLAYGGLSLFFILSIAFSTERLLLYNLSAVFALLFVTDAYMLQLEAFMLYLISLFPPFLLFTIFAYRHQRHTRREKIKTANKVSVRTPATDPMENSSSQSMSSGGDGYVGESFTGHGGSFGGGGADIGGGGDSGGGGGD